LLLTDSALLDDMLLDTGAHSKLLGLLRVCVMLAAAYLQLIVAGRLSWCWTMAEKRSDSTIFEKENGINLVPESRTSSVRGHFFARPQRIDHATSVRESSLLAIFRIAWTSA